MSIYVVYRPEEHIDIKAPPSAAPIPPDCTAVMDLEYSFHAFEHLEVGLLETAIDIVSTMRCVSVFYVPIARTCTFKPYR